MLEVSSYPRFLRVWRSDWSDGAISVGGRSRLVRAEGCGGLELSSRPGIHDIRPRTPDTSSYQHDHQTPRHAGLGGLVLSAGGRERPVRLCQRVPSRERVLC